MKKFGDFLEESLALEVKSEPKTNASREARKLGLVYMGFGRYADNKGQIAYVVDNDRLVPFKRREEVQNMYSKAVQPTNAAPAPAPKKTAGGAPKVDKAKVAQDQANFYTGVLNKRDKEDVKILKEKSKQAELYNKELLKSYKPNMFDQAELDAIGFYKNGGAEAINRYLYKGHDEGVTNEQAAQIEASVQAMDSAFENTQTPFAYTAYTGLSGRYNPESFKEKGEYIFRGYTSASLDFTTAIDTLPEGAGVVLQIEVSKGQKSIYADAVTENTGEKESLLPRGSKIQVISGPHNIEDTIVGSNPQGNMVSLFHCQLIQDV